MKMVMAVVPRTEGDNVLHALVAAGHTATFTERRGGMLRRAQLMLFIAVDKDDDLQKVLGVIRDTCHSRVTVESTESESDSSVPATTTEVGGAVVFVWDLESFEIY
ncbi:MAG: hypothetical protein DRI48_00060 [Chloroflexi bacterium]|nr:MAG: hypothetical protein DRI48_00060 [Chloroflexota bacterium]